MHWDEHSHSLVMQRAWCSASKGRVASSDWHQCCIVGKTEGASYVPHGLSCLKSRENILSITSPKCPRMPCAEMHINLRCILIVPLTCGRSFTWYPAMCGCRRAENFCRGQTQGHWLFSFSIMLLFQGSNLYVLFYFFSLLSLKLWPQYWRVLLNLYKLLYFSLCTIQGKKKSENELLVIALLIALMWKSKLCLLCMLAEGRADISLPRPICCLKVISSNDIQASFKVSFPTFVCFSCLDGGCWAFAELCTVVLSGQRPQKGDMSRGPCLGLSSWRCPGR